MQTNIYVNVRSYIQDRGADCAVIWFQKYCLGLQCTYTFVINRGIQGRTAKTYAIILEIISCPGFLREKQITMVEVSVMKVFLVPHEVQPWKRKLQDTTGKSRAWVTTCEHSIVET